MNIRSPLPSSDPGPAHIPIPPDLALQIQLPRFAFSPPALEGTGALCNPTTDRTCDATNQKLGQTIQQGFVGALAQLGVQGINPTVLVVTTSLATPQKAASGELSHRTATTIGIWLHPPAPITDPHGTLARLDLIAGTEAEDVSVLLVARAGLAGLTEIARAVAEPQVAAAGVALDSFEITINPAKGQVITEAKAHKIPHGNHRKVEFTFRWKETPSFEATHDQCPPIPPLNVEVQHDLIGFVAGLLSKDFPKFGVIGNLMLHGLPPIRLPVPASDPSPPPPGFKFPPRQSLLLHYNPQSGRKAPALVLETGAITLAALGDSLPRKPCAVLRFPDEFPPVGPGPDTLEFVAPATPGVVVEVPMEVVFSDMRSPTITWTIDAPGAATVTLAGAQVQVPVDVSSKVGSGGSINVSVRVLLVDADMPQPSPGNPTPPQDPPPVRLQKTLVVQVPVAATHR